VEDGLQSIDSLLTRAVESGASDLHVTVGAAPAARVRGALLPLPGTAILDADTTRTLLYRILTTEQQKRFEIDRQLDFSYGVPGLARFRVNAYQQRESVAAAFRVIPDSL
jgi:twitching motility protein PilT